MTYHDYKVFMKNRTRLIEKHSKYPYLLIPAKLRPIRPTNKIGWLDLMMLIGA